MMTRRKIASAADDGLAAGNPRVSGVGGRCLVAALAVLMIAQPGQAQTTLPLVQAGDLKYLGLYRLPLFDANGKDVTQQARGAAVSEDGKTLFVSGAGGFVAFEIPPAFDGRIVKALSGVVGPPLGAIAPGQSVGVGGLLFVDGRVALSAYADYDAGHTAAASHFFASSLSGNMGAAVRLPSASGLGPGWFGGPMAVIPTEWRTLFGGTALTGQCCQSIISRMSYGPTVSVIDPASPTKVVRTALGYTQAAPLGPENGTSPVWNRATRIGGVAFPSGTRSVLFLGMHGDEFCYGEGTRNPALHKKPNPGAGPGEVYCYDLTNPTKGDHAYPTRHQVYAYDANDLVAVLNGTRAMSAPRPYAVWTLSEIPGRENRPDQKWLIAAAYAPASRRLYVVTQDGWPHHAHVAVYEVGVGNAPPPPPPPIDCVLGTERKVSDNRDSVACVAGKKTIIETWTRDGDIDPSNGGKACLPAIPFTRTATIDCEMPPPPPTLPVCTLTAEIVRAADGSSSLGATTLVCK